jgi:Type II restriction endonuclease EcoO109I
MSGDEWIEGAVRTGLARFNATYADAVDKLELRPLLRKCNPWRLRALGLRDCAEVVRRLVDDHMSSSAESKFGSTFIETVFSMVPGVEPSGVEDIDFAKGKTLVSVKSGHNWGNNGQWSNLEATTTAALKRYRQHPGKKDADCILGIAVGRGARTRRRGVFPFKELRGQAFWAWASEDPEAYEKVMLAIDRLAGEYEERRDSALRRLRVDMQRSFGLDGGMVDWQKLNRFVSAELPP